MEEDSDTRSSFPSPFKQDVANGSACTPETDIFSFRQRLDMETNAPFLQNGSEHAIGFDDSDSQGRVQCICKLEVLVTTFINQAKIIR